MTQPAPQPTFAGPSSRTPGSNDRAQQTEESDPPLTGRRYWLAHACRDDEVLCSRAFHACLAEHRAARRRGGYRDPESQAFIESWFSKLKQRCIWREKFETLDEAHDNIGAYIDRYRPHSRLAYRTRTKSRPPGNITTTSQSQPPEMTTPTGSTPASRLTHSDRLLGVETNGPAQRRSNA